jgi:hypothetical protein
VQVAVEHLLPGGGVDLGGLGQYTIKVEETGSHLVRETQHASSLGGPALLRGESLGSTSGRRLLYRAAGQLMAS